MVKLLTFLFTALPGIFAAIFAQFSRKYSTVTATLIAFASITAIFVSGINLILQVAISYISVPGFLLTFVGMFIPANFSAVLGAVVSAKICRNAYLYSVNKVKLITQAT